MPNFAEYKEMARDRGSLAFEVFVVISRPAVGPEVFSQHLPDHLAYIGKHEAAGDLMLAGPWSDETGIEMSGIGFQVWRAESWEAAQAFAEGDPMHATGSKTYELRRWLINEGRIQLTAGLSTGAVTLG